MTNFLEELKNKKNIHVVGVAGIECSAIALFLHKIGLELVTLHDFSDKGKFEEVFKASRDYLRPKEAEKAYQNLIDTGYKINFRDEYLEGIEKADLIFISQGWFRYDSNQKLKELEGKIPFSSATELYLRLSSCPIIGVTGTVGKSTTARLIYKMLKTAGKSVILSGNDRDNPPVLEKILDLNKNSYLILEISNRQLINLNYSPHIAVVTNIYPNHLDDHGTYENYIAAKRNIVAHQKKNDFAVLNFDNKVTRSFKKDTEAKTIYYSYKEALEEGISKKESKIVVDGLKEVLEIEKLKLLGGHNILNIMAALAVGTILKVDIYDIQKAFYSFCGLKHRMEKVKEIKGVSYIEDSQSTNPNSTVAAIEALKNKKVILIAGGFRPKFDISEFSGMVKSFSSPNIKKVFLIGKIAPVLYKEYLRQGGKEKQVSVCQNLQIAVKKAKDLAKRGDLVLLSPGVESFGEFKDYRERGEKFKKLITESIK